MGNRSCWSLLFTLCLLAATVVIGEGREARLATEFGDAFPDLRFESLLVPEDYAALGLERAQGSFALSEIPGRLLVLEFFSQHCMTCQRQAPYLQAFFERVVGGDLSGVVRVLTVGVGNRVDKLQEFRRELALSYPIAADPHFERFLEIGDPGGTPFTVFLLRRGSQWTLADFHLGMQGDTELTARSRALIEGRAGIPRKDLTAGEKRFHPPLGLSLAAQEERALAFLRRVAGTEVAVTVREIGADGRVYEATAGGRSLGLYAQIASRDPVCDVCHAVHFLFAFDREGIARGYEPIHVTKFGNEVWNAEDTARMERILSGRSLQGLEFDPDVDAVASATMSSALIFDQVRRAAALLAELEKE